MMSFLPEKEDRKFFKIAIPIALAIIGILIFFSNRELITDPRGYLSTVDQAWEIRSQRAEKPLKEFNDSIFKWIAFRGVIKERKYDRFADENNESVEVYYLIVSLDKNIYNPKNVPLEVNRIYDVRDTEKAKIYWKPRVYSFDTNNYGDSIIKNYGEDFYQIKFRKDKPNYSDTERCKKVYYTTDFDYFWTIRNISVFIDSLYQANKK